MPDAALLVDVEAIPAAPPLVSLLSSVGSTDVDRAAAAGVVWLPEGCSPPEHPYWWDCPEADGDTAVTTYTTKTPSEPGTKRKVRGFTIWTGIRISAGDFQGIDVDARARRALAAFQSQLIEHELWEGEVAQAANFPNDYLLNTPTIVGGGLLGYVRALAELEQAIADNEPGNGVIHAQPRTVTLWREADLVHPIASGRRLVTDQGNIVVPGSGYTGRGPNTGGSAGGVAESYAYATGPVRVLLGPVSRPSQSDGDSDNNANGIRDSEVLRTVNDVTVRIERDVVVGWDGCTKHGVRVNHAARV